jgi:hypothetical protein
MARALTPHDIKSIMACGTGCLCLVLLVPITMIGVINGTITEKMFGDFTGLATGGGIVGLALLLVLLVRWSLAEQRSGDGGQ